MATDSEQFNINSGDRLAHPQVTMKALLAAVAENNRDLRVLLLLDEVASGPYYEEEAEWPGRHHREH